MRNVSSPRIGISLLILLLLVSAKLSLSFSYLTISNNMLQIQHDKPIEVLQGLQSADSMYPTFDMNDTIIVYKPTRKELKTGDIIVFKSQDKKYSWIIHRIIGINKKGNYITKGDANDNPDVYEVPFKDVKYKVLLIIYA